MHSLKLSKQILISCLAAPFIHLNPKQPTSSHPGEWHGNVAVIPEKGLQPQTKAPEKLCAWSAAHDHTTGRQTAGSGDYPPPIQPEILEHSHAIPEENSKITAACIESCLRRTCILYEAICISRQAVEPTSVGLAPRRHANIRHNPLKGLLRDSQ